MRAILKLPDETVIDVEDERVLLFGGDRFIRDICEGECCFICGRSPADVEFNDEHVIPDWILRRFGLHNRNLTLPNGTEVQYDRYKIPCCVDCNGMLGRVYEEPMARATASPEALRAYVETQGPALVFLWMALTFIKTHLKDRSLRLHRDRRLPNGSIADQYPWHDVFDIHALVRAPHVESAIHGSAIGSVFILPAIDEAEAFDYGDLYVGKAAYVRLGSVAIVAVLTDCGAAEVALQNLFESIKGFPLSGLQLRELMIRAAVVNVELKERPEFVSSFGAEGHIIYANRPATVETERLPPEVFGAFLDGACGHIVDLLGSDEAALIHSNMRTGRWTFLFDANNKFISHAAPASPMTPNHSTKGSAESSPKYSQLPSWPEWPYRK